MKPLIHAKNSAKEFGGKWEDYIEIHNFFDSSKACVGDMTHRSLLHHTFGCFIAERIFGVAITNSDGKLVSVRDVCEQHIIEDVGFLPTPEHYLKNMTMQDWMLGGRRKRIVNKFIKID